MSELARVALIPVSSVKNMGRDQCIALERPKLDGEPQSGKTPRLPRPSETWCGINAALCHGRRSLRKSSLAKLMKTRFGTSRRPLTQA